MCLHAGFACATPTPCLYKTKLSSQLKVSLVPKFEYVGSFINQHNSDDDEQKEVITMECLIIVILASLL